MVGDESSAGGALVTYFSARAAAAHVLRGARHQIPETGADEELSVPDKPSKAEREGSLTEAIKSSGWAVPVARRVDDLAPELLARVVRLSEEGVAHLFASEAGGGVILAMAGSTAGDRRRAAEKLPPSPGRPLASRRVFGVLLDAGEPGSHYSEEEGWGLTVKIGKASSGGELEAAAGHFRASREGSLAVAETKAERRRIEANRKRLRAGFVARRRRSEELGVRSAREIDAERAGTREAHWTEDSKLRRHTERASKSGRAAYDTARAVYLQQLPTLAHRLLHLLRREDGAVREREFISRHTELAGVRAAEPGAILVAALRELADAGKVRRLRSRETDEVFLAATESLDEGSFRRSLNVLIRNARFGIVCPWAETNGVEPQGEVDEEALLSSDHEDIFPEETGRAAFLDNVADEDAQEEIETLTA